MQRVPLDPLCVLSTFMASVEFRVESVVNRKVVTAEDLAHGKTRPVVMSHASDGFEIESEVLVGLRMSSIVVGGG